MSLVILLASIVFITGKAKCRENEVFAIPGCTAELEWAIGANYLESFAHSVNVFNQNGIKIAEKKAMKCKDGIDSSVYCEVRNTSSDKWRFIVVLFNVTQANSGKYTGQIKYGTKYDTNITTELKIIDNPQIKEARMPILHEPLQITCNVEGEFEDHDYHWKLNGTYVNFTEYIYAASSNLTFERLTPLDKFSLFTCEICSNRKCCVESDTYAPDPYYGPENLTLNLNNSDYYLRLNESFKVMCLAKCYPMCTFLWDGFISSKNEELLINSFNSNMAGVYRCIVTNHKTGVTVKSDPIFLHYVQDSDTSTVASNMEDKESHRLLGFGVFIVASFLVSTGIVALVIHRHKHGSRGLVFPERSYQPDDKQYNTELSQIVRVNRDRPLPTPDLHTNACNSVHKSNCPKMHRRTKSLQNLLQNTQDGGNPVRKSMSLQTLIQLSLKNRRWENDDSLSKFCSSLEDRRSCSMKGTFVGMSLGKLDSEFRNDKDISHHEQNTGAESLSLSMSRPGSLELEHQEDLYSTIDEADVWVYSYGETYQHEEKLQENSSRNSEIENYNYDYAALPSLQK